MDSPRQPDTAATGAGPSKNEHDTRRPDEAATTASVSPVESRRQQNSSDETAATSVPSDHETTDKTTDKSPDAVPPPPSPPTILPLLTQPSDDEAAMYYQWLPSQPTLLGRTSAGIIPWSRETASQRRGAWNSDNATILEASSVGQHPLRQHWYQDSFQSRLKLALQGLALNSILPIRVGRQQVPERQRQVLLWIAVGRQVTTTTTPPSEPTESTWPLIARSLRLLRVVLDSEGLIDMHCEIKISENTKATSGPQPRYVLPSRGMSLDRQAEDDRMAERAISTTVGTSIAPLKKPWSEGTLCVYLGPNDGTGAADEPVWALTCHHCVFPPKPNVAASQEEEAEDDSDKDSSDANPMLMPAPSELASATKASQEPVARAKRMFDAFNSEDRQQGLEQATTLRDTLVAFSKSKDDKNDKNDKNNCVFGTLYHAPTPGANEHPDEAKYTRDWALIKVDKSKFPDGCQFENYADMKMPAAAGQQTGQQSNIDLINAHLDKDIDKDSHFTMPTDGLLRLSGPLPIKELLGGKIVHSLVKTRHGDPGLVLLKPGRTTGLTVGVALDMEVMTRLSLGDKPVDTMEWPIMHISMARFDPSQPMANVFSATGDSGAAIFNLEGRVAGQLTGGTSEDERKFRGFDITYATPFDFLLKDIEREIGFPVRIL